ncbi:MAG TPA: 3-isopropylmalate dehydrogenase [Firmicutes bacterium]|nr:3-isopropylmalate dehydrogenase [Bacillota bacterium]HOQ23447.1 3-isopropylmalate dehydrogenase [Bacillota bacterium]HPT67855.1 3-isopropylmalate dehydrogenase [Bacillota bacterium]
MFRIAVLPGDGIGREIVPEAVGVLQKIDKKYGLGLEFQYGLISEDAYAKYGHPLPQETIDLCKQSQAVLLGAVGSPQMDALPAELRPERAALLPIRKILGLFANLRLVTAYEPLLHASTLKPEVISGIDILVVRELTGGLYFGEKRREGAGPEERAVDTLVYTRAEIERILRFAFAAAHKRRKHLTSVDKANVLTSSQLWREVAMEVAKDYPDVELHHMYVDNCAMQLVRNPKLFDVIVTENMFGDILTDQASMLSGSLGMLPSASLGGEVALYEPAHGSAPDIAGQNKANPLATILSAALLLRYSLHHEAAAKDVEAAVVAVLNEGLRTPDIMEAGCTPVGTTEMGEAVRRRI